MSHLKSEKSLHAYGTVAYDVLFPDGPPVEVQDLEGIIMFFSVCIDK